MCYNRMNISVQEVLLLKRTILALLICALLATVFTPAALGEEEGLYNAVVTRRFQNSTTKIYSEMDTESKVLKWCNPGHKLVITKVFPNWVEVKYGNGVGYVLRLRVDVEEAIDPVNTPPYGVEFNQYYTVIHQPTQVYADKNRESEVLSTLTKGAKVGFIGFEDGYAKLIHKRQYGYVDTRDLSVLYPVAQSAENHEGGETPIAVYTSFYSDNPSRIMNLELCCEKMNRVMQPGDVLDFNNSVGPFTVSNGYQLAPGLKDGKTIMSPGGGSCQVSSTLFNTIVQLPGVTIVERHHHGNNFAPYLPAGMDASSGVLNFQIRNDYDFPIRIEGSCHDLALFIAIYKEVE